MYINLIYTMDSLFNILQQVHDTRTKLLSEVELAGPKLPDPFQKIVNFCLKGSHPKSTRGTEEADSILEIGSGSGFLASLLPYWGIKITPTDIGETGGYNTHLFQQRTTVYLLNHIKAVMKYGSANNVLMLAWPPLESNMATEAVEIFTGSKVIYIGECFGGSTANDKFFYLMLEKFNLYETVNVPNWIGTYSLMYLYERK